MALRKNSGYRDLHAEKHGLPELTPPERFIASFIRVFGLTAILLVAGTFLASLFPGLPKQIPIQDVPRYWSMSASQFTSEAHIATGWGWVTGVPNLDVLNLLSLALFASTLIFCFIVAAVVYVRERDYHFAIFCGAEALILLVAASGIV